MRAFLQERHLKFTPSEREVEAAWTIAYVAFEQGGPLTKDAVMKMLFSIAIRELAPRLKRYSWTVEHCRKAMLFTSDRPVMYWRQRSARDRYEGVGIETADETRIPITPNDLLVVRRSGGGKASRNVQPKRFERVNASVASQCHEFVVATTHQIRTLGIAPARASPTGHAVRHRTGIPGFARRTAGAHR